LSQALLKIAGRWNKLKHMALGTVGRNDKTDRVVAAKEE
jgi:hypothetical protein